MAQGAEWNQCVAAAARRNKTRRLDANPNVGRSALAHELEELFSWGVLSGPQMQRLASAACTDGCNHPELLRMSACGAAGASPEHIRRDFLRQRLPSLALPTPTFVPVPFVRMVGGVREVEWLEHPIMIPQHTFVALQASFPEHVQQHLLGEGPRAFWSGVSERDPRMQGHPCHELPGFRDRLIPIVLHGDAAIYNKSEQSMLCVQWSSMLTCSNVWDSVFLITCFPKHARALAHLDGHDTWQVIWDHIAKGLQEYMEPAKLGFQLLPWVITGDLEYLNSELKLPHWNTAEPCLFCRASRQDDTRSVRDIRRNAGWREHLLPPGSPAPSNHVLFEVPGLSRDCIVYDWMHTVDMGVVPYMVGSTLREIMEEGRAARSANLSSAWARIQEIYAEQHTDHRISKITPEMIAGKLPVLTRCKAAELRSLVPVMRQLCQELSTGSVRDTLRVKAYESLESAYQVVLHGPLFLKPDDVLELRRACVSFLELYHTLCSLAWEEDKALYNVVFKHHAFFHACDRAQWGNPRWTWCYKFEDFMGKMVVAASSCSHGTSPELLGGKVLQNYRLALSCRLTRPKRTL